MGSNQRSVEGFVDAALRLLELGKLYGDYEAVVTEHGRLGEEKDRLAGEAEDIRGQIGELGGELESLGRSLGLARDIDKAMGELDATNRRRAETASRWASRGVPFIKKMVFAALHRHTLIKNAL